MARTTTDKSVIKKEKYGLYVISSFAFFPEDDVITVKTPAFAESVTEGDVRWEKGKISGPTS